MTNKDQKKSRAYLAGVAEAKSTITMIHLFYQNNTARNFLIGLLDELHAEVKSRGIKNLMVRSNEICDYCQEKPCDGEPCKKYALGMYFKGRELYGKSF